MTVPALNHLVDVALPLPLGGPFTYSVPAELVPKAQMGRRVFVPFRNKIRAGFIVDRSDDSIPEQSIRPIDDIPDEPPYLTPVLWKFLLWIAEYYLLPVGTVLRTALPPGSARTSRPWAILTPEGRAQACTATGRQGLPLPRKLIRQGYMLYTDLAAVLGADQVEEAVSKNWLRIEERISRPRTMLRNRRLTGLLDPARSEPVQAEQVPDLTPHQDSAVREILEALKRPSFESFLLYGVTGSGKTEVYLRAIQATLEADKTALVLVPEIALTPQLAGRFIRRFQGGIGLFHSGLTPAQRLDEWRRVLAGQVRIVIAARSGIFLPMHNLGLIVVDEEHDASYKQHDSCPYNARDMALARGKLENATVILGSATPSFETFVNSQKGKIRRLDLPYRHHGGGLPRVELVDLRAMPSKKFRNAFLTPVLVSAMEEALARQEQVVVFLNRRGFDTFAQCRSCGYVFKCPNCDISLTHHKRDRSLRCHLCGFSRLSPPLCAQCSGEKMFFGGTGTQKVEEELTGLFPDARIERLDRDSTRKRNELESILERFRNKQIDILTGTQMIVKGHDFPGISLVAVLCGDLSLHFPDFRATERTFQMLTQVAGRTGRETDSGRVILQTFDPDHQAIKFASTHSFEAFFQWDAVLREELNYPPFGHLILIRVEGNDEARVENKALKIGSAARMIKADQRDVMILGPAPAPRKKIVGKYRWQLLLKAQTRPPVRNLARQLIEDGHLKATGLRITVDVDPMDLM